VCPSACKSSRSQIHSRPTLKFIQGNLTTSLKSCVAYAACSARLKRKQTICKQIKVNFVIQQVVYIHKLARLTLDLWSAIGEELPECQKTFTELVDFLKQYIPRKRAPISNRIKWMLNLEQTKRMTVRLERHKASLNLTISANVMYSHNFTVHLI
jgi:hypothetical protein